MLNHETQPVGRPTGPLEHRLASFGALTADDLTAIRACCDIRRVAGPGSEVSHSISREPIHAIAAGWAAWARTLADGRRQILRLLLPGDVLGPSREDQTTVVALTRVTLLDAGPLAAALRAPAEHPALRIAWERAEAARDQELMGHILRLGRLSAYERTAHLMLEIAARSVRAGLAEGGAIPWLVTQEAVADTLGLSIVHVNRTLQQLRRERMIELRGGELVVRDPERLAVAAAWTPAQGG